MHISPDYIIVDFPVGLKSLISASVSVAVFPVWNTPHLQLVNSFVFIQFYHQEKPSKLLPLPFLISRCLPGCSCIVSAYIVFILLLTKACPFYSCLKVIKMSLPKIYISWTPMHVWRPHNTILTRCR